MLMACMGLIMEYVVFYVPKYWVGQIVVAGLGFHVA